VREAVAYARPIIPFANYRGDFLGDGEMIVGHMLCSGCASRFGLSIDEVVTAEVLESKDRFPYVCPVCAQCFEAWSAQDRVT
jgi:hypothetical protein